MTEEQNVAYINAMVACALIRAQGMTAENKNRECRGDAPAYTEKHFSALIEEYGIHHNAVITQMFHNS